MSAVSTNSHAHRRRFVKRSFALPACAAQCVSESGPVRRRWSSSTRRRVAPVARRRSAGLAASASATGHRGSPRAACRLLGLHRLEGPICQARVLLFAKGSFPSSSAWRLSIPSGHAPRAGLPGLGNQGVRRGSRADKFRAGQGPPEAHPAGGGCEGSGGRGALAELVQPAGMPSSTSLHIRAGSKAR